jgi:hypothetical protein
VVLWEVAARYHFAEEELLHMPIHRLLFWHHGHQRIKAGDQEEIRAMFGAKGK